MNTLDDLRDTVARLLDIIERTSSRLERTDRVTVQEAIDLVEPYLEERDICDLEPCIYETDDDDTPLDPDEDIPL